MTFLHDPPQHAPRTGGIDWLGIALLIVGVGSLQYVLEEGNIKDWFESRLIVYLSIVAAVASATLLWWQLTPRNPHPVIQLRVLRNRDLAASIFLFIVLGFGLYGGVIIFPLFTQSILGFSPTQTGLAMMPGGLMTALMALACGRLLTGARPLVDPRVLILAGMAMMMWAMWDLGHLSTSAGEADARYALIIRGAALGLLFTPINNVAFGSLKPQEAQQASGLINLARQLGGQLRHRGARRLPDAAHRVSPRRSGHQHVSGQPRVRRALRRPGRRPRRQGWALADAQQRALAVLDATMMRQAAMRAYNDAWLLLLAIVPLRRPRRLPAEAAARRPGGPRRRPLTPRRRPRGRRRRPLANH